MTSSGPVLKTAILSAPLNNGVGRFVCQLQRVTLKFCKEFAGSRGVRDFIEKDLVDFARRNPGVVVYLKPRRHRTAVLKAEFLNGQHQWMSLHNMPRKEVFGWVERMRTRNGEPYARLPRLWFTQNPSIQGVWNPYTHASPALNVAEFPSEEFSATSFEGESASEYLEKILAEQKNVIEFPEEIPLQGSNENRTTNP